MALPYFIKYIYNSGTDEVIRRGKKIYTQRFVELVDHDELMHAVSFRVRDDSYTTFYKVNIQRYDDPKSFSVHCTCPYNLSDICRHEAAALMQLQDLIDKNLLSSTNDGNPVFNQKHTVVKIKFIDLKMIRMLAGMDNYTAAEEILRRNKCTILHAASEKVEAELDESGNLF
ncbi:MAG: helicase SNF2, partial [Ginsengibacter sp.]